MTTHTERRARTRQALVDAVAGLIAAGDPTPSMEDVVAAAEVSRATAYRYFDSVQDIIWHIGADRDLAPVDTLFDGCDDVVERVLVAESANNDFLFGDPDGARNFERAALDRTLNGVADALTRPARRLVYLDAALEPLAPVLDADELRRLRHALALTMGSQAVPALLDTCRLDVDEARETTRYAARAIITDALRRAGVSDDVSDRDRRGTDGDRGRVPDRPVRARSTP